MIRTPYLLIARLHSSSLADRMTQGPAVRDWPDGAPHLPDCWPLLRTVFGCFAQTIIIVR